MPAWLAIPRKVRAAQKRWEEAIGPYEEVLAAARRLPMAMVESQTLAAYGGILAGRGQPQLARSKFRKTLGIYRRMHAVIYQERIERSLAEIDA